MHRNNDDVEHIKKEKHTMSATMNQARPCTISESIIQSCKEVKSMREGRTPKRSLNELFANIEKWSKEEEE
ncbi:MAG: hypothetical protein HDR03_07235 [Lachnospiraceae bacterium]|nr:hypothetical protein [Lachnospiraceae bacterium]